MKQPLFRLKALPLNYLWAWLASLLLFVLTELLIPAERCHLVHCALDDLIPFCELFVIPYVFWYLFIAITMVWLALRDPEGFKRFMTFLLIIQCVAIAIYVLLPSRQELRPAVFQRDNALTQLVGFIYSVDTNTGVCPSLHVAYSLAVLSAWLKQRRVSRGWKAAVAVTALLICLSILLIKQHSAVDLLAALPLCLLAEVIAYRRPHPQLRIAPQS